MLPDAGDRALLARSGGIPCPRCGRPIVILVGKLGPCEPCQRELIAEREARREARGTVRPCAEGCGATVTGPSIYCGTACRSRAYRRRRKAAVA
jgi:hypothetical protein